jgi:hypothetical protein
VLWATIDAPWLSKVDAGRFAASLEEVRRMAPQVVLSSHLPPAPGMAEQLIATLAEAPEATPFVGPDQEALMAMMAGVTGEGAAAAS